MAANCKADLADRGLPWILRGSSVVSSDESSADDQVTRYNFEDLTYP